MITSSFNSGAGKIELNILSSHTGVVSIAQLGQLRYAFDQTPDTLSIDKVQALYTYMNVDFLQYDDGGRDLWEVLISETNEGDLQATLNVVLPDGEFGFLFKVRKADISLMEKSGIVKVRFTPFTNFNTTMGQLFDTMYGAGVDSRDFRTSYTSQEGETTNYRYKCIAPADFINYALSSVFGNGYDNIIRPSLVELDDTFSNVTYDSFQSGKNQLVLADVRTENAPDGTDIVAPASSEANTEVGVGQLTSLGLPTSVGVITVGIDPANNVSVGDIIYMGDDSLVSAGRKLGVVTKFLSSITNQYEVLPDEDDVFNLPFGSYPFKIARAIRPETKLVVDTLKDMAAIEGSVFGTGFSKNFFINRLREEDENLVTVNYNEVIDFKPFNFDLSLGRSNVDQLAEYQSLTAELFGQWQRVLIENVTETNPQVGSGVPNLGNFSSITRGNEGASKGIDIKLAPAYPHLNKGRVGQEVQGRNLVNSKSLEAALTRNGLRSYFQSLNSTKDSIAVEFTVIGSQRVLPYELFQFDSRAPEKYRDKQFRITEVSYDFVKDTCKVKGYQISSITTPVVDDPRPRVPPPRIPPAFVGDPIGILNRGIDDEDVDSVSVEMYQSTRTGGSLLILNSLEREQGYFQDNEAGQYEVTLNNADVPDPDEAQFVGVNMLDRVQGDSFTQISIRTTSAITLTAGQSITIRNISGQFQALTVAQTVTTVASTPSNEPGTNSIVVVEPTTAQNFYQGTLSYVHLAGYTPKKARFLFPVGVSEIPIQEGRVNAPKGSFVYGSSPYNQEDQIVTKQAVTSLNVALTNVAGGLNAAASAITKLNTTVSNINGVVTAQSFALTEIKSNISNIDGHISAQSTALTLLNTRVVVAEGYIISNASAITAIQSNIDGIEGDISGQATAISSLQTNVSLIGSNLSAQAQSIDFLEANVTTLNGSVSAFSSDISDVRVDLNTVTGEVTNISAKRAIAVGAGGKLAEIDLTVAGNGSGVTSFISISADQVAIQNIVFDEAGAVYSNNFITSGGVVSSGVVTNSDATEGWAFDRAGKLYADTPFFRNVQSQGGSFNDPVFSDPIIVFPTRTVTQGAGTSINTLSTIALEIIQIQITVGDGSAEINLNGIEPVVVNGTRIGTKVTVMNSIDSITPSQLVINNQSGSATAVNRIKTPTAIAFTLARGDSAELFYDVNISRWIIIGTNRIL